MFNLKVQVKFSHASATKSIMTHRFRPDTEPIVSEAHHRDDKTIALQ